MRVFWDTNLFIYLFEEYGGLTAAVAALAARMAARRDGLLTSTLTLGEFSAGALKGGGRQAQELRERVLDVATVVSFDIAASARFAAIRNESRAKAPDAIQLACATVAGAHYFVTNDDRLSRIVLPGGPVITSLADCPI